MNTEPTYGQTEKIKGTIINVSFPRSGHRFLREILSGYFEERFIFYESYTKQIITHSKKTAELNKVNYVKTHDFNLLDSKALFLKFPKNRKYLVQVRHPLESITSYYEFSLKHGFIRNDTETAWQEFLEKKLKYWKRFCDIWLIEKRKESLLIKYNDLYVETLKSAEKVVRFLTGNSTVNLERLTRVIEAQEFLQYVGDKRSKKQNIRQLDSFKYFQPAKFARIESELSQHYLNPHGITLHYSSQS